MTTLVVGASGATGRLLVQQLLDRGEQVRAIVRAPDALPAAVRDHANVTLIHASILQLDDAQLAAHVVGCDAVASCLGHTLSLKGIYGHPRQLVTEATRRLCRAIEANEAQRPTRFVLMNTTGNSNRDLDERISFAQHCVIGLLRLLLPPHVDNEKAADHLRVAVGQNNSRIEWVVVRPDTLLNEDEDTPYEVHPSPIRSAIFDAGTSSRINVAHFMASLIKDDGLWRKWKGQMPVVYNAPRADSN